MSTPIKFGLFERAASLLEPDLATQVFIRHIQEVLYPFQPAGGVKLRLDQDLDYYRKFMHVEIGHKMIEFTVELPLEGLMIESPIEYVNQIGEQAVAHIRAWQCNEVPDNIILADN